MCSKWKGPVSRFLWQIIVFATLLTDIHYFSLAMEIVPYSNLRRSSGPENTIRNFNTVLAVFIVWLILCPYCATLFFILGCSICPNKFTLVFLVRESNPRLDISLTHRDLKERVQQEIVFFLCLDLYQVTSFVFAWVFSVVPRLLVVK